MSKKTLLSLVGVCVLAFVAIAVYAAADTNQTPMYDASITNAEEVANTRVCGQDCGKDCQSCEDCDGACKENCKNCNGDCENCDGCLKPCERQGSLCGGHGARSGCSGYGCRF